MQMAAKAGLTVLNFEIVYGFTLTCGVNQMFTGQNA